MLLEKQGARKLSEYNAAVAQGERLPRLLVVIDEAQAIMQDKETRNGSSPRARTWRPWGGPPGYTCSTERSTRWRPPSPTCHNRLRQIGS